MKLYVPGKVYEWPKHSGKWQVRYQDPRTGRRVTRRVSGGRAMANAILAKIKTEITERGIFEDRRPLQVTLEECVPQYLAWAKANKSSWQTDARFLRRYSAFFKGKFLSEITPEMVERYKAQRSSERREGTERPVTPRQVQYELAILKAFFNKAILWGKATTTPMRQVKFPRVSNQRTRYLTPEEVERLLHACEEASSNLKAIVVVALQTGLRRGELLRLRWSDVDYRAGVVHIRTSKNGEARVAYLNEPIREALRSCMGVGQVTARTEDLIFRNRHGQPYRDIREAFGRAIRRAGIADFRFHDLRHTFASYVANLPGSDRFVLQRLMGHKTASMTDRYSHLFPSRGREVVEQLARSFGTHVAPAGSREVSK